MSEELLAFNGVNGSSGQYGLRLTNAQLVEKITGLDDEFKDDPALQLRKRRDDNEAHLGVKEGVDGADVEQAGWGIVFAAKHDQSEAFTVAAIKEALQPLLDLRRSQTDHFKVYEGPAGYKPNERKSEFLKRIGADPSGVADPVKAPYYLLLIGSPATIPYEFQYQLDVQYGVGRLHFETLQEYANYANSVVVAETQQVQLPRRFVFFGVANSDDKSTELSAKYLVRPLVEAFSLKPDWEVQPFLKEAATKSQLHALIGGLQTPALLFTASHGMEFDQTDKRQIPHQGALLCQDWPGPNAWRGEIPQDLYFAGDDVASDANLLGLITFHFACYGAGTPLYDEFSQRGQNAVRRTIAPRPFIAGLPTKLLGHPKGGALAVLGHVERAWGYSFMSTGSRTTQQTVTFESTLDRILKGDPVGWATEYFNGRYAAVAADLSLLLDKVGYNEPYDPYDLTETWTTNNDARGYVILGDPAVRLPVAVGDQTVTGRVEIKAQTISVSSAAPTPAVASPKPAALSDEDWARTPDSVKNYIRDLEVKQSKS